MGYKESILDFMEKSRKVLKVSKKPDREEYLNVAKITGIGIILVGVIGLVINLLAQLLGK